MPQDDRLAFESGHAFSRQERPLGAESGQESVVTSHRH
jgi:hypothetical protein